ncbi:hypothetical protein MBLNU459_g8188t1 [Dothideomycetes sp. NU459]
MAAVEINGVADDLLPPRKKPKVSELPLSSAKRSSIDSLLHTFKKKGEFDALRKKTYAQFEQGASKSTLIESLRAFTDAEIERDPAKYLVKDRRLAAPLLEGAAARADIYPTTEADINRYISDYLQQAEQALRGIRRKEIGQDAALEEEAKGAKSDDAYAADAEVRRQERAKRYIEHMKVQKKKEREERRKAELDALKAREQELKIEKERLEREQKRRAERERVRKIEEEKKRERLKAFEEERERMKKLKEEEKRRQEEELAARKKKEEEEEAKRLKEEAMRLLLREGEALAEKTSRRHDRDRSESIDRSTRRRSSMRGSDSYRRRSPTPDRHYRRETREERVARQERTRESTLREISAEREAWKAKMKREKEREQESKTRDTAAAAAASSVRARSKASVDSRSKRHERSRSPLPSRAGDRYRGGDRRSRSRSPPRRSYRERDYSPPRRRRSRTRSPPDIDRYVPGQSSRRRDDYRERDRDRDRERDRECDRGDRERDRGDRDRDRGDRDRDRGDRERDRRRTRDHDEGRAKPGSEIDRYIPSGSRLDKVDRPSRRDRSRSRSREAKRA